MIGQHAGQEVDGLDMAEEKALVFQRDAAVALKRVDQLGGLYIGPDAGTTRKGRIVMAARRDATGHLEIQDQAVAFDLVHQAHEHLLKPFLGLRDLDINQGSAPIDTVDMLLDRHRDVIKNIGNIVHPVAEITGPVVHRHRHFLDQTGFSVVVGDVFHRASLLMILNLEPVRFPLPPDGGKRRPPPRTAGSCRKPPAYLRWKRS